MFFPSSRPLKIFDFQQVAFTLPKAPRLAELTEESLRNFGVIPPDWVNTSLVPERLSFNNGVEIVILPHALILQEKWSGGVNKLQIELITITYLQKFPRVRWVELGLKKYVAINDYPHLALTFISTNLLNQTLTNLPHKSLVDARVSYYYQLEDGPLTLTVAKQSTPTKDYLAFTGEFFYNYRIRQTFASWTMVQRQFLDIVDRGFLG